ncbi:uncharacterized protein LOC106173671 [Lingula anatina]|nr:uncharacterized protein LOC106173671 [Lingula anatina]|eukprot:XP_023930838.1 uncharacterized protein LOC106173671 [Lingula anatina]
MEEIPGLDNYPGKNVDDGLFEAVYPLSSKIATQPKLNSAYYNRWFRVMRKGAMGLTVRHRGYSDESIFTAQTTQQKVAGMHLDACNGRGKSRVCVNYYQKWSYAVPLFVTYLTPLGQWNPYNLKKQTNDATVTSGGRTGGLSSTKAYNGYSDQHLYLTPAEFFSAPSTPEDPIKGVLDAKGTVRSVRASGQRFVFPEIPGVRGRVRQTYPIFPVHTDGSVVSKELAALVDMVTKSNTFANLFK